uniref:CPXV005 protein n=1 Tax=Schistosoma curassoni TaxID=6186 RepID=A0A183L1E4_9TREM
MHIYGKNNDSAIYILAILISDSLPDDFTSLVNNLDSGISFISSSFFNFNNSSSFDRVSNACILAASC